MRAVDQDKAEVLPHVKQAQRDGKRLVYAEDARSDDVKQAEGFTSGNLFSPRSRDIAASSNGCRVYRESILRPKESQAYTSIDNFESLLGF